MNTRDDMSDSDVLTAVRDRLSGMPLARPPDVDAIMAKGRARRNRRLIPGVTGALALAAGAALAATALAPASHEGSHQASRQPPVQLAAWTVTRLAGGNISVTIRELKDPAGLQSTLRADGVPASVTFAGQPNTACQPYPGGTPGNLGNAGPATHLLKRVFPKPYQNLPGPLHGVPHVMRRAAAVPVHGRPPAPPRLTPGQTVIVIDPSALPRNAGVQLGASFGATDAIGLPQVVYASPQCTGS
jgi:hypothetical protein